LGTADWVSKVYWAGMAYMAKNKKGTKALVELSWEDPTRQSLIG
jgi:hypothetical protein